MSTHESRKFVHLLTQSKTVSSAHKRETILAVREVEKDIKIFVEKLKEGEDFLNQHPNLSPLVRQNLITTLQKGKEDLALYNAKFKTMTKRLMAVLKDLSS